MKLTVENVWKTYPGSMGPVTVLQGVSFALNGAETLALTGESGSGKSTLLHLIGGLDTFDSGQVMADGVDVATMNDRSRAAYRRNVVGIVFQQFNLIPSLTIRANIAFQARLAGRYDNEWADRLAGRMGLADHLDKYPEMLSGGQQQRVAIARALAARPKLLLADEPTGNLDEENADIVLSLMLDLAKDAGTGVLMVTHSQRHASRLDRRIHLRGGSIEQ